MGLALIGSLLLVEVLPDSLLERTVPFYASIHLVMEMVSIIVSFMVFGVGWNTYPYARKASNLLLASGFLSVGILDLIHTLSHPSMPDFLTLNTMQKAIVSWLLARLVQAATFLWVALEVRSFALNRWAPALALFGALGVSAVLGWVGVFHSDSFPVMFVPQQGLTSLKIGAEWFIILLHLLILFLLFRKPGREGKLSIDVNSLVVALIAGGLGETYFTKYQSAADYYNLVGHLYKGIACLFIYRAVFMSGIREPFRKLELTQAELSRAVRVRDEFLMMASHELKTPMTPLRLQVEMVLRYIDRYAAGEISIDFLRTTLVGAKTQAERMTSLIEQLMDFTQLRGSSRPLRLAKVDLLSLARESCQRFLLPAKAAGYELRVQGDAEVIGDFDQVMIEQLFANLLGNAMKYGNQKPIEIEVRRSETEGLLFVRDQGIGIDPKDHQRIFERFERATFNPSFGGIGLGLSIVAEIVRLHGGRISVKSGLGQGTEFAIRLPLTHAGIS